MQEQDNQYRSAVCGGCGDRFTFLRGPGQPKRYCSDGCRAEANRRRAADWYYANPKRVRARPSRDPKRVKAYNLAYYQANRDREIQRSLAYARGAGKQAKRARDSARYALTRGSEVAELFTLDEIFVRDGEVCHLCGEVVGRRDATMDHVIPVTKGGPHTLENVKLAHRGCNTRKGNRLLAA